jgi:hypothetical protein
MNELVSQPLGRKLINTVKLPDVQASPVGLVQQVNQPPVRWNRKLWL